MRKESGYTLTEMLIVLAIIGVMAAVTIPAFFNYMRTNRGKTSLRNLISDVRTARATAIGHGHQVKLVYVPDVATCTSCSRTYDYFEGDRAFNSTTWTPVTGAGSTPFRPSRTLDTSMYFPPDGATTPQDFPADPDAGSKGIRAGAHEIVFYPDGHIDLPDPSLASGYSTSPIDYKTALTSPPGGAITIHMNPKTYDLQYTVIISATGRVKTL